MDIAQGVRRQLTIITLKYMAEYYEFQYCALVFSVSLCYFMLRILFIVLFDKTPTFGQTTTRVWKKFFGTKATTTVNIDDHVSLRGFIIIIIIVILIFTTFETTIAL
uniref:Uncharacterized protein n=1 Tax=Schizaphis graminum TaxID=13262 RepID=A0A2S2PK43_SCHGA